MSVLIVNMPFSSLRWPNLGPSLLQAAFKRRGIACDMAYTNFDFAERVGLETYAWIADSFAFVLGGERLFAQHYFGQLPDDDRYYREVLLPTDPGLSDGDRRDFEAVGRHVVPFLDQCVASVDWSRYAVVGFATTFQQTMPSVCLARRIKQLRPQIRIAFGGAACEDQMGRELLRQFPEIDYVFLGEADVTFPWVVEQILAGGPVRLPPGVAGREDAWSGSLPGPGGVDVRPAEACPTTVPELNDLPYPDFDGYFARLDASPLKDRIDPLLFVETSRGCWWGQKHHCKFCGLNGDSLAFRSKHPQRAVEELAYLVRRHGVRRVCTADNILDHRYFDTFLPLLCEAGLDVRFEYELKTNLTRPQVATLIQAGLGAAQLGIETFRTPLLKRIGKGASAVQNLQALKWFSEAGIEVKWNFLYGFPGEEPEEYRLLAELLPAIIHLAPPMAAGQVRLDRFSPYFQDPPSHGMVHPRPNRAFEHVYPFPQDVLARLAYYFEYDYADGRSLDYVEPVREALAAWTEASGRVTLRLFDRPDGVLLLTDTRPCAAAFQHRLTGLERAVYLDCDTGRTFARIVQVAAQHAGGPVGESAVRRMLDGWLAARLMVHLDDRYLSLALRPLEA